MSHPNMRDMEYPSTVRCVVDSVLDEPEVSNDPIIGTFSREQMDFMDRLVRLAAQEALLTGMGMVAEVPVQSHVIKQDAEDVTLEFVSDVAEIDAFHRGYLKGVQDSRGEQ